MPLGIGVGLNLATRSEGVGYAATLAKVRAHLAALDGTQDYHANALATEQPTITTPGAGIPPATGLTNAYRYNSGQSGVFRVFGGRPKVYATDYIRMPVATRQTTGGNVDGGEDANASRIMFDVDAAIFSIRVLGTTAPFRAIVDGHYIDMTGTVTAGSSGRQFINYDYTSAGGKKKRTVIIEAELAQGFDGVHVAVGDAVTLTAAPDALRMLVLGDSYVGGADGYRGNDIFPRRLGDRLGIADVWGSGIGTTGYIVPTNGSIYNLQTRIDADINRMLSTGLPPDIIMLSMGNNDQGQPQADIQTAAEFCISRARALVPTALIFVNSNWDAEAPAASGANYVNARGAVLAAASGREAQGIWFLDQNDFAFDKVDGTHPDNGVNGHAALAARLDGQIQVAVAA